MNIQRLRIYHLDYFNIMLDVVRGLLNDTEKALLVGQSTYFGNAQQLFNNQEFDTLLLGLNNAAELRHEFSRQLNFLSETRLQFPKLKIVVYSMNNYADDIAEIMNRGANWYLGNTIEKNSLLEALDGVKRGQQYINERLYRLFKNSKEYFSGFSGRLILKDTIFSSREIEILRLIASGCSSKEISDVLRIAQKTVETHRKNLIKKSRVKNTPELVYFSYQHGFL